MKIAFVINQTHKEEHNFTTTLLAFKALQRGHDIFYIGLADFYYDQDLSVAAHARAVKGGQSITDNQQLIEVLRNTGKVRILLTDMDVVWLRFDPVLDMVNRPWAATAALQFATLAKKQGVWVINDPETLSRANDKLYLENFDQSIRPKTIITRQHTDVIQFYEEQKKNIILKPLKGSGGKNVFLINEGNIQNLKQTVEAIARDGYVIAQEYLPAAQHGDIRFFLLKGRPLALNGKYAAVHRVQQGNEIRSNVHQGAKVKEANIDSDLLNTVEKVSAQLIEDNMYLVGLDIVADKIMEINVFSPGALYHADLITGEDFSSYIIEDLEQKIAKK